MSSFYSSTTSLNTPSPLDRNKYNNPYSSRDLNNNINKSNSNNNNNLFSTPASQQSNNNSNRPSPASIYPSLTPNNYAGNPNASTSSSNGKSVRFNSQTSIQQNTSLSPSRLVGTPPTRLVATPSSSSALANPSSLVRYPVLNSSSRPTQQSTPTIQPRKNTTEVNSNKKSALVPLGRGEVANRLRVNSVLLVIFWLSSRTDVYGSASAMLAQAIPALDTPLQFLQNSVLLILFFNIVDSMYKLQNLSSLPTPVRPRRVSSSSSKTSPSKGSGSPYSNSTFGTPLARSSPKTRPAPSMSPSPSLARTSSSTQAPSLATLPPSQVSPFKPTRLTPSSQNQNQNQSIATPTSESRRISNPLRRSLLGNSPTTLLSSGVGEIPEAGVAASALSSYLVRHHSSLNGTSPGRKVTSREEIDRLFE